MRRAYGTPGESSGAPRKNVETAGARAVRARATAQDEAQTRATMLAKSSTTAGRARQLSAGPGARAPLRAGRMAGKRGRLCTTRTGGEWVGGCLSYEALQEPVLTPPPPPPAGGFSSPIFRGQSMHSRRGRRQTGAAAHSPQDRARAALSSGGGARRGCRVLEGGSRVRAGSSALHKLALPACACRRQAGQSCGNPRPSEGDTAARGPPHGRKSR